MYRNLLYDIDDCMILSKGRRTQCVQHVKFLFASFNTVLLVLILDILVNLPISLLYYFKVRLLSLIGVSLSFLLILLVLSLSAMTFFFETVYFKIIITYLKKKILKKATRGPR